MALNLELISLTQHDGCRNTRNAKAKWTGSFLTIDEDLLPGDVAPVPGKGKRELEGWKFNRHGM